MREPLAVVAPTGAPSTVRRHSGARGSRCAHSAAASSSSRSGQDEPCIPAFYATHPDIANRGGAHRLLSSLLELTQVSADAAVDPAPERHGIDAAVHSPRAGVGVRVCVTIRARQTEQDQGPTREVDAADR